MDKRLLEDSEKGIAISEADDVFKINGPLDLTFLMKMYGMEGFDHLKHPKYMPQPVPAID